MTIPPWIDVSHTPLWQPFCNWCSHNGVDMAAEEDYKGWWECYLAGASCMYLLTKQGTIS